MAIQTNESSFNATPVWQLTSYALLTIRCDVHVLLVFETEGGGVEVEYVLFTPCFAYDNLVQSMASHI
jgi:hypothetical protein